MSSRLALIVLASAVACGGRPPPAPSVEVPIARVPLEEPALEAAIVAHDATPTFPDAVASYRPTERLERGLRVPLPRGVGLPRCDLYIQAEVMRDDAYWVAEDIHRIAVAGEDCPTHLAFDQAVPSHRLTVAGGWLAKPGGPPVPPGKPQLFDLLDVTFDGVPELRISDLSHASHHVFLMRVPGRAELVHLAALDYLPNLRIDPLGRRLVSEEVMETFSWLRREYAWERGALVLMRRVRTWRGTNPRFEPIGDENATWRLEVERRGDAYEVVFDGLQTPAPVVPLAPVVATPPATPPAITGRPIFPDALAPKMLAPSAPLVGLRVPLPTAPGIPKCDLYLEGEVSTQGEESWAEKIERITVAGDDCPPHLVWDSRTTDPAFPLEGGVPALVDVTFDGIPEIQITASSYRNPTNVYLMVDPTGTKLMHLAALDDLTSLDVDTEHEQLTTWTTNSCCEHVRRVHEWRGGRLVKVAQSQMWHESYPDMMWHPDGRPIPENHVWVIQLERRGRGYEVVHDGWTPAE